MSVGENIKNVRKKRNMSQKDFAEFLGISKSYMSELESNKRNPSIKTINKISEKLDVPVLYLLEGNKTFNEISEKSKNIIAKEAANFSRDFNAKTKEYSLEKIKSINYDNLDFLTLKAIQGYISLVINFDKDNEIKSFLATIPQDLQNYALNYYSENERIELKQDLLSEFNDLLKDLEKYNKENII